MDKILKEALKLAVEKSGLPARKFIEQMIAPELLGPAPKWAGKNGYQLGRGAIFNSGAFCVYYGKDPESGKILALVHIRSEKFNDTEYKQGAVGGYTETPEQAFEGVIRERAEEICDDKGLPVMRTPAAGRHILMIEGKDFVSKDPPVQFCGYACELNRREMEALIRHHKRMEEESYRKAVHKKSKGETRGIALIDLSAVGRMDPRRFTYSMQLVLYKEVAYRLGLTGGKPHPSHSPLGHTISDWHTRGRPR